MLRIRKSVVFKPFDSLYVGFNDELCVVHKNISLFLFHKEAPKKPIATTGYKRILTHRSAISTLLTAGCCVVVGAVPRTLFMVKLF